MRQSLHSQNNNSIYVKKLTKERLTTSKIIKEDKNTYRRLRDKSAESNIIQETSGPLGHLNYFKRKKYPNLSKSNTKSLSDLLSADINSKQQSKNSKKVNKIDFKKKSAIKKFFSTLGHHNKLVVYSNFTRIKRFSGFLKESSDDSIVKLGNENYNYQNNNNISESWEKYTRKRK